MFKLIKLNKILIGLLVATSVFTSSCSMQLFRNKTAKLLEFNRTQFTLKNTHTAVLEGTSITLLPTGGIEPYRFAIIAGGRGSIDAQGVYTAPASAIPFSLPTDPTEHVQISVTDAKERVTNFTIYVTAPFAMNSLSQDMAPTTGTFDFDVTGGKPPYAFSVLSGAGSIDNSTGVFTAPATQGISFVKATDSVGNSQTAQIYIFDPLDPTPGAVNIPVNGSYVITPANGKPNWGFAVTVGAGSVSPATSGTSSTYTAPAAPGSATVRITDALGITKDINFNIYALLTYNPTTKNVQVSTTFPFGVVGGVPAYTHATQSGAASGSINAGTGLFTATATVGTTVVEVTDSIGNTNTATVNVYPVLQITPTVYSLQYNQNHTFSGIGGVPPYTFSRVGVGSIVAGTGVYSSGTVSGTATVTVTDSESNTASATVTVSDTLLVPPTIILQLGNAYTITPTGGQTPYNYALGAGTGNGTISAATGASTVFTSTALGTKDVVTTDSSTPTAQTGTTSFQINPVISVSCTPLTITVTNTSTCTAADGTGGYVYSVVGGAVNGTVTAGGVYTPPAGAGTYTVRATDSFGNFADQAITVNAALAVTPAASTVNFSAFQDLVASGGVGAYSFALQPSSPAGSTLSAINASTQRFTAGTTAGTGTVTITDALGNSVTATIGVNTPPNMTVSPATRNITRNKTNVITPGGGAPSVTGAATYNYSVTAGLGGVSPVSGASTTYTAPNAVGAATVTIADSTASVPNITVDYTIVDPISISPTTLTLMVGNSYTFTRSNGVSAFSWSVTGGAANGTVTAGGLYTAPAAVPGGGTATVNVSDSNDVPDTVSATVTIRPQIVVTPASASVMVNATQALSITGGVPPYTYSYVGTSGSVSPASGAADPGSATFTAGAAAGSGTFTATDSLGNQATSALTVFDLVAPTGFAVTGATPTSINTSWSAVTGATAYKVQVNAAGWVNIGNVLTYNFTGLASGSLHTLEVRATNAGGDGPISSLTQRICAVDNSLVAGACTACNVGEYSAGGTTASCTACTNGAGNFVYTNTGGGINNCPYTCNGGYGSGTCAACGSGTWDSIAGGQEACANCGPGNSTAGAAAATTCTACAASTYSSAVANLNCTSCSVGQYSLAGATSCSVCTNNTTGNYWTSNGTTATGCTNTLCTNKAGTSTYTGHGGTTNSCAYACDGGYGSSTCAGCGAGTWDSVAGGQEACANCSASTFSSGAANTSCTSCAVGQYSLAGAASCSACTNNTTGNYWTSNGTTATGCTNTLCTNKAGTSTYTGHGGTTNSCAYACDAGYGASTCAGCGAGTWDSVAGGQEACANCGPGNSTAGSAAATTCSACAAGNYSTAAANLNCTACANLPGGTAGAGATAIAYTGGNTSSTCNFTAYTCPANSTGNADLTGTGAQCNCNAGYAWNGTACQALINCYTDGDADTYGAGPATQRLSCLAGESTNNTDCCDANASVRPNNTTGSGTAIAGCNAAMPGMNGSWDYNCSGINDPTLTGVKYISSGLTNVTGSPTYYVTDGGSCQTNTSIYYGNYSTATNAQCGVTIRQCGGGPGGPSETSASGHTTCDSTCAGCTFLGASQCISVSSAFVFQCY